MNTRSKLFDGGVGKYMRKATHLSIGMDLSNPCRGRSEWLHHHGDGVCNLVCAFCAVSSGRHHASCVDEYHLITIR
jgi:hypothetical protein